MRHQRAPVALEVGEELGGDLRLIGQVAEQPRPVDQRGDLAAAKLRDQLRMIEPAAEKPRRLCRLPQPGKALQRAGAVRAQALAIEQRRFEGEEERRVEIKAKAVVAERADTVR